MLPANSYQNFMQMLARVYYCFATPFIMIFKCEILITVSQPLRFRSITNSCFN